MIHISFSGGNRSAPACMPTPCTEVTDAALSALREVGMESHTLELEGGDADWDIVPLQRLLVFFCEEAPSFRRAMSEVVAKRGNTLSIVVYSDGLTPGSLLTADNKRKSVIWYASFLEFFERLAFEELWMTPACARWNFVKDVPGGCSHLTRLLLRSMLLGSGSLATVGIELPIGAGGLVIRIFARFTALLGDEDALAQMWSLKGSGGRLPCAIACSLTAKPIASDIASGIRSLAERDPLIHDITCSDVRLMGLRSDEDVWKFWDEIAAAKDGPVDTFKELQMNHGFRFHEDALLNDKELRQFVKPTSNRFDVQHILFSNGLLGFELMRFLESAKIHEVRFAEVRQHFEDMQWLQPKGRKVNLASVFSDNREKSSPEFLKAGASELLAAYPAFRHFAITAFGEDSELQPQMDSLFLLCELLDLVCEARQCKNFQRMMTIADKLEANASVYLEAFKVAYGSHKVRLKHHELQHLANQIRLDAYCFSCWTPERKHIKSKSAFDHIRNPKIMESGALGRMMNAQLRLLANPSWVPGLTGLVKDIPELHHGARISAGMRWPSGIISNNDVLFVGDSKLAVVVACIEQHASLSLLVRWCRLLKKDFVWSWWSALHACVFSKAVATATQCMCCDCIYAISL